MLPDGNTFTVEYGRIGQPTFQTKTYPISKWDSIYNNKTGKGYVDQTDLVKEVLDGSKKSGYRSISESSVAKLVERLQRMAKQAIKENYTISSSVVTKAMVDEAQQILIHLGTTKQVEKFNEILLQLFRTIPRKMKHVSDFLAKTIDDFAEIVEREQDLLDIMKGQVIQNQVDENIDDQKTILETMGLKIGEVTDEEIRQIKKHLGSCADKFHQAWVVENIKTQKQFYDFINENNIKEKKLLWHGSRNENWWNIINTGLLLRPNATITGKMFGYGIYFATKAIKSLGYTSIQGSIWARGNEKSAFLAVYQVAYGKPYDVYSFNSKYYDFNYDKLQRECVGATCLHAHEGNMLKNDEIVVYKECQTTIKYLVELR
jgi:poly [ADP-ribose] polymerase